MAVFDDLITSVGSQAEEQAEAQKTAEALKLQQDNNKILVDTITGAVKDLIAFEKSHQPKVSVTNQKLPTSVKTPDVKEVVKALENLKQPLQDNKPDDTKVVAAIEKLNEAISKLPTEFPAVPEPLEEVTVKNQPDYTKQFDALGKAIKGIDVKPVVNIPDTKPNDYSPIIKSLTFVVDAVQAIKIPQAPKTDLSPLVAATEAVKGSIEALRFPVANYVLPFITPTGKATQAKLNDDGSLQATVSDSTMQLLADQLAHLVDTLQAGLPSYDVFWRQRVITDTASNLNTLFALGSTSGSGAFLANNIPPDMSNISWGVLRNKITTS